MLDIVLGPNRAPVNWRYTAPQHFEAGAVLHWAIASTSKPANILAQLEQ